MTPILLWILCHAPLMTPTATPQPSRAAHRAPPSTTSPTSRPTTRSTSAPIPGRASKPLPPAVRHHGLQLTLHKSHTVHYHQFYRIQQTAFGKDTKVLRQHNITYKVTRVKAPTPQTTVLKMTFVRVQVHLRAGALKASYDSRKPGTKIPAQAHILAAFVGHSFKVHLRTSGHVQRVRFSKGMQRALNKAIKSHPIYKMLRGEPQAAMARQLAQQYSPTQWRREMANMWSYLPPRDAKQRRWRRHHTIPLYGMTQRATWSRKTSPQQLEVRGELRTPRNATTPFAVGATFHMSYDLTGTTKGRIQLDPRTRLPQKGRIHVQIKGHIRWTPPTHKTPKRTWPMLLQYIATWQLQP